MRVIGLAVVLSVSFVLAPLAAEAQPAEKPRHIGWLGPGTAKDTSPIIEVFRDAFRELGYIEGQQYVIDAHFADGRTERLPRLAAELTALPVDVIIANNTPSALAAMQATRTIPIVTVGVADPVGSGLIQSFSRPGGNVTGTALALDEVSSKWLELLGTLRGRLSRAAVIHNSTNRSMAAMLQPLEVSARTLGVALTLHDFTPTETLAKVFSGVAGARAEGLVVLPDALLFAQQRGIHEQAARLRLPAIYGTRNYALSGGLMSYGADPFEGPRRAASYVDKILKGTKPADLPVERSRKFELVINMKTAKALGLTIPQTLLLRADQVIQ
jgi:putative tryptophan/tyrosine transport system substrate-binding protein